MTAFAIFVMTTGGLVQIQRITRERAPLSMMVLGRGSERLPVSERYDDFVYPGGGPVERFLGPFPDGGFRLEVSGPIDSGDSWQLAAFIAHAVLAAEDCSLCREVEEADKIVCLTGLVDFDGAVGGVGHIPEKLHAVEARLREWVAGGVAPLLAVPRGADHERLLNADPPEGVPILAAANVGELCQHLGIALASVEPTSEPVSGKPKRRWPYAALLFVLAAGTVLLFSQTPSNDVADIKAPLPAPKVVSISPPPPNPEVKPDAKPAPKPRMPGNDAAKPSVSRQAVNAIPLPSKLPALGVIERHAPPGQGCAQIYFGQAEADTRPVPLAAPGRFKSSGGDSLCGILLRIELGGEELYAMVALDIEEGRLVGALRPPPDLSGRRLVTGRRDWALDLPHRIRGDRGIVRYRLTLTISDRPIRAGQGEDAGQRRSISLRHEVLP
ncbi:MAG: hypothetical protein QF512_02835 [Alphaproteobacteria bacterium]|nr:hypothetical protein [Alphaproteobacteria bacterium]